MKKEAIRVSTTIPVAPTTLYYAWLSAEQHAAMTGGGKAKIEPDVGTKFTAWDGYISGKLITLDLGRRIIMSWRTTEFPRDAHDSRVEVHLEALGPSTRLTVLHTEIPEGQGEKYRAGWVEHYFDPMRRYFSQYLPDPRLPPPVRQPPPPMDEEEEEDDEAPKGKGKLVKGAPPKGAKVDVPAKGAKVAVPAKGEKAAVPAKGAKAAVPAKGPGVAKAAKPAKPATPAKPAKKPAKPAKKPAKPAKKPATPAKPAKKPAKAPAAKKAPPKKAPPAKKKKKR